jgi:predicted 2-oxoglutarate/Fe(II)-dependent dioxygenase YbiX
MTFQSQSVAVGERAPFMAGAGANGAFFSLDGQAGRPVVLPLLGKRTREQVLSLLQAFESAKLSFADRHADIVPLASLANGSLADYAMGYAGSVPVFFCASDDLFRLMPGADGRFAALVVDRGSRLTAIVESDDATDMVERTLREVALFTREEGREASTSAPVLIVPNLIDRDFCRELIARFETGPHMEGVMASMNGAGDGYAKLDKDKKHRRDFILEPTDALHARVVEVLARRLVPEIKRAFQADVAHLDRILIARYDDTGGYFRRHRDDAAAHISYRQFALSLNLNTDAYEGGHLMFPEFSDDRFSPPAGGAAVFSASLLHEATSVTRGRRYVLLTFLHNAEAEARRLGPLKAA